MSVEIDDIKNPVVLFDGVCNLCNKSVQFIIKHDKKRNFRFASLQSDFGEKVLQQFNLPNNNFSSFILLENGTLFMRSTAALKVLKKLNGLLPVLYAFIIIPKFIRDGFYNFIAKNRYKWFGKKDECWIPSKELSSLFIGVQANVSVSTSISSSTL